MFSHKKDKLLAYIRNFGKNRDRVFSVLSVLFLVIMAGCLFSFNKINVPIQKNSLINTAALTGSKQDLSDLSGFSNVQRFEVPNAKATVVYFPQVHKDPTTQPNDPKNNNAAVAQKQIYNDLEKMNKNYGVTYVMDETDLFGPMPADKVQKMKNGFEDIKNFREAVNKTADQYMADGGSQDVADKFKADAEKSVASYERNLYLTGGAAVLAAQEPNAHVYGSQNEATLNESKKDLEDMVYLDQRINQLQGGAASNPAAAQGAGNGMNGNQVTSILSMLKGSSSSGGGGNTLAQISTFAQSKSDQKLLDDIKDVQSKSANLSTSKSFEAMPRFSEEPHTSNPYTNETNINVLKAKYDAATKKFMAVAKDRRSQEVADNVAKMMEDNNQTTGALVFGAQHQDQIVDALNKKGISVIVITEPAVQSSPASK